MYLSFFDWQIRTLKTLLQGLCPDGQVGVLGGVEGGLLSVHAPSQGSMAVRVRAVRLCGARGRAGRSDPVFAQGSNYLQPAAVPDLEDGKCPCTDFEKAGGGMLDVFNFKGESWNDIFRDRSGPQVPY